MEMREAKGSELADRGRVVREGDGWTVFSLNGPQKYRVVIGPRGDSCSCPDWELRQADCKHIHAVKVVISRQGCGIDFPPVIDTPPIKFLRPTYGQDWDRYEAAQENEKDEFLRLLFDLCSGIQNPPPKGGTKGGRPPVPLADAVYSTLFKIFSTFSGRRFASDLRMAHERGYVSRVIDHCSIARCLESEGMTPIFKALLVQSALPLRALEDHFAVDSSGFSGCKFDRWYAEKYGHMASEHTWVKAHVVVGVATQVVVAAEVLDKDSPDSPQFRALMEATAQNFTVGAVSADKAYSSGENHEIVAECGGVPYIAFRANASGAAGGLYRRMFHLFSFHKEAFLAKYHARSNVESAFSMSKRLFGDSVRSKTPTAMRNEVYGKLVCHNLSRLIHAMYELGITPDLTMRAEGKPEDRPTLRIADFR